MAHLPVSHWTAGNIGPRPTHPLPKGDRTPLGKSTGAHVGRNRLLHTAVKSNPPVARESLSDNRQNRQRYTAIFRLFGG